MEQGKHGQKYGQRQSVDGEGRRQVGEGGNRSSMMPWTGSRDVGAVPSRGHSHAVGRPCPCPREGMVLTSGRTNREVCKYFQATICRSGFLLVMRPIQANMGDCALKGMPHPRHFMVSALHIPETAKQTTLRRYRKNTDNIYNPNRPLFFAQTTKDGFVSE